MSVTLSSSDPFPGLRVGDQVEFRMTRDSHGFVAGDGPRGYRRGETVRGQLIRINHGMRRLVLALPTGLTTFHLEDVEAS